MHSIKIEIKHEKQLIMVNLHLYEGRTSRTENSIAHGLLVF